MKEINNHSVKIERKDGVKSISIETFMSVYEKKINNILDEKTRDLVSQGLARRFGKAKPKKRFFFF